MALENCNNCSAKMESRKLKNCKNCGSYMCAACYGETGGYCMDCTAADEE